MQLFLSHLMGRLLRLLPKHRVINYHDMRARFFVPINCHYVTDDLRDLDAAKREPQIYQWLNDIDDNAVYFDIGTSYGQEVSLVSSLLKKNVTVVGFDCSLYQSHFCALNKKLNDDRFRFIFAAVGNTTGELVNITTNSDTHIPSLHPKNVPYNYDVMTITLDDFSKRAKLKPTHIKIDIDGAEFDALRGAETLLKSPELKEIFVEIDNINLGIIDYLAGFNFKVKWQFDKPLNKDVLFVRG